jgi:DNA invertase Pin-like site-specific DNA recombinase
MMGSISGNAPAYPLFEGHLRMRIGYVRVSREDQNPDMQRDALLYARCDRIFEDRISGACFDRSGLKRALTAAKPGSELIVWKLDRLGRSMLETLSLVLELDRRGVTFRSLTESFDTKTPIGRGVLAFIAAVAEDERERIRERTKAGMAAAKKRGKHVGRPRKLSAQQVRDVRSALAERTATLKQAAALHCVSAATLRRALSLPEDVLPRKRSARCGSGGARSAS